VIPYRFLRILDLDLNLLSDNSLLEKADQKNKKVEHTNNSDKDQSGNEEIIKNPSNNHVEDDDIVVKSPDNEESKPILKTSNFVSEVLSFFNFFCIIIIWTFHWIFPFKTLATGIFKINKSNFLYYVNNNTYMNYFMFLIFLFIVGRYVWNHIEEIGDDFSELIDTKGSVIISVFKLFSSFFIKVIFIILVSLYFLGSVNNFYKGINLTISNKLYKGGINLSAKYFNRFHIHNKYGQFRNKLQNQRKELEIKYQNQNGEWKSVNFAYKPSILRNNLLFNMPHQPRLDWQMTNSAYSPNIESEHYLVLLLGKICEKNPVILDLLGYKIHEKENFYKCNFILT
jgi:hypothetical protein